MIANNDKKLLWITQYFLMKYMQKQFEFDVNDFIDNSLIVFTSLEIRAIKKWWQEMITWEYESEIDYMETILILEQYMRKK